MRKLKQRLCGLLLCGAMLASLCPAALAEDVSISYLDENGEVKLCETYKTVTPDNTDWNTTNNPSGWYVAQGNGAFTVPITVTGEVYLILVNGCELNATKGIQVSEGNSLTIYAQSTEDGMGALNATGIGGDAGIGGGNGGDGGTIIINGGTVTAISKDGAGIGGGGYGGAGGKITINGGTVSVTPTRPERGDTVTVKPKPDEGYELDSVTVTDRKGEPVEVTAKPDGTYTFKQPAGKVKIEVAYKPIETPWNNPFADVSEDDWYYEAVRLVQERGLMNGYSDGRFGAEDTLSRSQPAQILFNGEGRPGVDYLLDFSDVAGGAWYAEAVRWAASQSIVSGHGDGTFGPDAPITREQLAVMLWRYSGSPASSKDLDFNDGHEISPFALEALRWAVENGILNGDGDGQLAPQDQATRAQAAQMLKNFIEHQEEDI